MRLNRIAALAAASILTSSAGAANIYILSSGNPAIDSAVALAMTSRGHTASVGVEYWQFDGTQNLAGFQTVYFQANSNWSSGDMPAAGQQALAAWVSGGGRLVTSEWVVWKAGAGVFTTLSPLFPTEPTLTYGTALTTTYARLTPDPVINAGLPNDLSIPLDSYAGTETFAAARAGATTYYTSDGAAGAVGLTGWARGSGFVFCFSTTCGPTQVGDANFGRLLANVMGATAAPACYPNCDGSTSSPILNVVDFICFGNRFAAGDSYANCDHSTGVPVLSVADFVCFLNSFAAGCT